MWTILMSACYYSIVYIIRVTAMQGMDKSAIILLILQVYIVLWEYTSNHSQCTLRQKECNPIIKVART